MRFVTCSQPVKSVTSNAMLNYFSSREAIPASIARNLYKTTLQTIIFWSIFLFVIPWLIVELNLQLTDEMSDISFPYQQLLGICLFVIGGCLGLSSSWFMVIYGHGTPLPNDCARQLVIYGWYQWIRNPMAIAGITQAFAVGIWLGSWWVVIYALIAGPIWHFLVRPWEEADLYHRFGEPYQLYRQNVRCWWPRLTPYRPSR